MAVEFGILTVATELNLTKLTDFSMEGVCFEFSSAWIIFSDGWCCGRLMVNSIVSSEASVDCLYNVRYSVNSG